MITVTDIRLGSLAPHHFTDVEEYDVYMACLNHDPDSEHILIQRYIGGSILRRVMLMHHLPGEMTSALVVHRWYLGEPGLEKVTVGVRVYDGIGAFDPYRNALLLDKMRSDIDDRLTLFERVRA